MSYRFGYNESVVDINRDLGICLWVCTDLPIWHFRIYNSTWYSTATKMARVLFTSPTMMYMMDPCTWFDIDKDLDLIKLDKYIGDMWKYLINTYNYESNDMPYHIPEDLIKPDYTKLTISDDTLDYYYGIDTDNNDRYVYVDEEKEV